MAKQQKKSLKIINGKEIATSLNDGMNTPVPDRNIVSPPSETEAALIKQAENPLGDPNKV